MNAVPAFLVGLGRVSLEGAILVPLVLLAQRVLARQLAPRWRCALWLVVMARLVLPVSVSSVASIFNVVPKFESTKTVSPSSFKPSGVVIEESRSIEVNRIEPHGDAGPMPDFQTPLKQIGEISVPRVIPWPTLVMALWLVGVVGLSLYIGVASWRMTARFSAVAEITDPALLTLVEQCLRAHGVRGRLLLAESPDVTTPALYGFFRPKLLLPPGFAARFSASEMRFILLHEVAHIKRRDIAFNWLAGVLQIVHWFNPLVWFGFSRWRADRELACDAMALDAAGPEQNCAYGQTILRLLEGFTPRAAVPGLVGILEDKRQLRRRIAMIADYVPRRKWQILALSLLAALAVTGLTDAQNKSSVSEKSKGAKTEASPPPVVTNGAAMKLTVVDAQSGQPLSDAEVLAPDFNGFYGRGGYGPRWTTDKNGTVEIHLGEISDGHLEVVPWFPISVRHVGYAPRGFSWSAQNKDVRPSMPGELAVRLERGLTAGGVVRDEQGAPIAGIRVRMHGSSYWGGLKHEYSEYWTDFHDSPTVATDASSLLVSATSNIFSARDSSSVTTDRQGRWEARVFPHDIDHVVITLSWPDGSGKQFTAAPTGDPQDSFRFQNPGEPFNVDDLRSNKLALTLKGGNTVKGVVLDPKGRPLAGVPVKAGYGIYPTTRLEGTLTDGDGRFEFRHVLPRHLLVTVCPNDFAVTSAILEVNQNTTQARVRVDPLQPLRVKVEDGKGQPMTGAAVSVDQFRTEGQLLDFSVKTDGDGTAIWTNAPIAAFALRAVSPDGGVRQKIRVSVNQREITFKLRPGMNQEDIVTARAHDAATGAPVHLDSIRGKLGEFSEKDVTGDETGRLVIPSSDFVPGGQYPTYRVEARAKGYANAISAWRDFDEGDWSPEFALEPSHRAGQVVLLPDGSPAANATVWSDFGQTRGLSMNQPGRFYGQRLTQTRTAPDGSYELPGGGDDDTVIFTYSHGFLKTTVTEIKRNPTVRLQPYGRVEGVLRIAGQPRVGFTVNIAPLYWYRMRHFNVMYTTTTGADGGFYFSDLPPGDYKLYRQRSIMRMGPLTEDHQMPIAVKAGETLKVDYSNSGRQVIGQAVAQNPDLAVDWLNDDHTLTLKQPPLQSPSVNNNDYATVSDARAAQDGAHESAEALRQTREARTYVLEFDPDGSFHGDDVSPGTYQLRIRVTKPGANRFRSPFPSPDDDLGLLEREVVVPPGDGPLDLGKLTVKFKEADVPEKTSPADFTGHDLDGTSISLSQYRGKYLLLTFWATWSDRCAEQLEDVRKLQEQFGKGDRIAFLGISLGEDAKTVRETVESRGYKWTQAELDSSALGKVTGSFNVSSLPAIFLLDTHGRVVASNLEGDRLRSTLQRELKN